MTKIDRFQGQYRFLSNFWPCSVVLDGKTYPSVEHAYQAAKTIDPSARLLIRIARTPGEAKRMGRQVELRKNWNQLRIPVMGLLLRQKFQDPLLRSMLNDTGDVELVEGNTWGDTFWGVCNGKGENRLGKLLMEIRHNNRSLHD